MKIRNVYGEIKVLELKLNNTVTKYGIEHKKTRELSEKIDELINYYYIIHKPREYPKGSFMFQKYKIAYDQLRKLTNEYGVFPTVEEWNKFAKENNLLSSESIKYISKLDWKELRIIIQRKSTIKSV